MYGVALAIVIAATLSCALASSSPGVSSAGLLIFWRVVMGIGVGGDYPLSSVITAEFAPTRWRGAMVGAVFSMQGLGQLAAALVALVLTAAFRDAYLPVADEGLCGSACRLAADRSWRIIVGVGALPACFALYYRITIPETPRYTFDVRLDVEKADADIRAYVSSRKSKDDDAYIETVHRPRVDHTYHGHGLPAPSLNVPKASWGDLLAHFGQWKNLRILIGTSMSWFFLDLAFYGLGLNSTIVLRAISYADGDTLHAKLHNQALGMVILACAGSIPGYWAAVLTVDTLGRRPLQIGGFLLLTAIFCVLGFRLHDLGEGPLLALYVVAQFLFNAGPNTTTFLVAGECFPTRYRATGHGISAAMGKLGAVVAQVISIPLLRKGSPSGSALGEGCVGNECSPHLDRLLQLFALAMLLGALASLLVPETKGLTLEELSGEPRTSYNAGRNGSIALGPHEARMAWPNILGGGGGQPAGFFYPRAHGAASSGKSARGSRAGIITSQSSVDESVGRRRPQFWRRRRRARARSGDAADDIVLGDPRSSVGSAESPRGGTTMEEEEPPPPPPPQQQQPLPETQLPLWGAGWGRVDRGRPMIPMDEVQLHDVGSLLRTN